MILIEELIILIYMFIKIKTIIVHWFKNLIKILNVFFGDKINVNLLLNINNNYNTYMNYKRKFFLYNFIKCNNSNNFNLKVLSQSNK